MARPDDDDLDAAPTPPAPGPGENSGRLRRVAAPPRPAAAAGAGERGERERQARRDAGDRPPRDGDRPFRNDRPRDDRPFRAERPSRDGDRPFRDDRAPRGAYADRDRPAYGDRERSFRDDRDRPSRPVPQPPAGAASRPPAAPVEPQERLPAAPALHLPHDSDAADAHDGRVRVSKLLSERGICSRREADSYIEQGWVTVDGKVVEELGARCAPEAVIELSKDARAVQQSRVTFLLHKPVGYVSGQAEKGYKPASILLDGPTQWEGDKSGLRFAMSQLKGLAPAGRLDIDSTGLLVLTQDGRVARHLIGDETKVEKEYLVRVSGRLDEEGMALLNHGLELDGKPLRPAKVSWQNEDQLRFVLREGRYRQIRRMCELVGLRVEALKRVRIGRIPLGAIPPGEWRFLLPWEKF
ncbi:pseudouridine synthase [Derxia gummosa]|uniref:Dual-specificity RNA pseudouridine synthase RluF n=1 Tax=Derxia gummosa DSM 723 TaxID=1121388 RepID=A0ABD8HMX0_9BURK